jgi:hypothetical protein
MAPGNAECARPFSGVHCETVATGTLLRAAGFEISEAMLLKLSSLPLPFIGGRSKPFELTMVACRNLGLECHAEETSSKTKAWARLVTELETEGPVGLQLDCFYLRYFERPPHFAGHFIAALRLVGDAVEVADTLQQGGVHRVARTELEAARHARGPMSAKARMYMLRGRPSVDLATAARAAIRGNANSYLSPKFSGMGSLGFAKLAKSLPTWLKKSKSPSEDLRLAATLMERAGTGGALFRNLYRDFLAEATELVPSKAKHIGSARDHIAQSAELWARIAQLLDHCAADGRASHLNEASALCRPISEHETSAMRILAKL